MKGKVIIFAIALLISIVTGNEDRYIKAIDTISQFLDTANKEDLFKMYIELFAKTYELTSEEGKLRFNFFVQNVDKVKSVNSQNLGFTLGINQFSDLSSDEFQNKYLTKRESVQEKIEFFRNHAYINKDQEDKGRFLQAKYPIDWSRYLKAPRAQLNCGACWAFASTALLEGTYAVRYGALQEYLSVQQLLDCDVNNGGCNGGSTIEAYRYIEMNGLMPDNIYPYKEAQLSCRYNKGYVTSTIQRFSYCSNYFPSAGCTVDSIYRMLQNGPVAVGIDGTSIGQYRGGIFSLPCYSDNHAVLLVGYGTENSKIYYVIRNSWGPSWGESGHVRVLANESNVHSCFVTNEGVQPILR